MREARLEEILNNINNGLYQEKKFAIKSIHHQVDLININTQDCINLNRREFYDFYLIKGIDTKDKYVGIIYDMDDDLHIVITKEYRGQGYLKDTLCKAILPFMYRWRNKKEQELTFEHEKVRNYFIEELGFISHGPKRAYIYLKELSNKYEEEDLAVIKITKDAKDELVEELNEAILRLRMINRKIFFQKYNEVLEEEVFQGDLYRNIKDEIVYE